MKHCLYKTDKNKACGGCFTLLTGTNEKIATAHHCTFSLLTVTFYNIEMRFSVVCNSSEPFDSYNATDLSVNWVSIHSNCAAWTPQGSSETYQELFSIWSPLKVSERRLTYYSWLSLEICQQRRVLDLLWSGPFSLFGTRPVVDAGLHLNWMPSKARTKHVALALVKQLFQACAAIVIAQLFIWHFISFQRQS